MNPVMPIIAVKAGSVFQVYDLRSRKSLHRCSLNFSISFWTWISSSVIVSDDSVYHWYLDNGGSKDEKNAVHYVTDPNMKWFVLTGFTAEDNHVIGVTQIYSADHNLCQNIEAHCILFSLYHFKGNVQPSCVLIAVPRNSDSHGKISKMELCSNANPSTNAYPPTLESKKKEKM